MRRLLPMFLLLAAPLCSPAALREWNGSSDNNWFNLNNWTPAGVPAAGDAVIVSNSATILLTNDTAVLSSFTITNATLTFTNWYTSLSATNVTIENGGTLSLPGSFVDGAMSNRIHVVCSNMVVENGGLIDADWNGYAAANGPGSGGAGTRITAGGYGGKGGTGDQGGTGGNIYGSRTAPLDPGSGGCLAANGGSGGGAIRIDATGTVTVNGVISANGRNRVINFGAGGSGGSVYITCDAFAGSVLGLIEARGGDGDGWSGRGGGGRIAVVYNSTVGKPAVRFSTSFGSSGYQNGRYGAEQGTLFLSDIAMLSGVMTSNLFTDVDLFISGVAAWSVDSLTVSNCSFRFAETNFLVTVTNDVWIDSSGSLGTVNLDCGGNLTLTNGGELDIHSDVTNGIGLEYGALLSVTGTVFIGPSSWIYPFAHITNGGGALLRMSNLVVAAGGGINADDKGYKGSMGPGLGVNGDRGRGGGYGGQGGKGSFGGSGGQPYGLVSYPFEPGSGGANLVYGGYGGGSIRIEAADTVTINGTVTADGGDKARALFAGGSGGGILIICDTLAGSNTGLLSVDGGGGDTGHGGGGGGGRIAVIYNNASPWPGIKFSTSPGVGRVVKPFNARQGSVYLSDDTCLTETMDRNLFTDVDLTISNVFSWSVNSLTITNCSFRLATTNFVLTVTNSLLIGSGGEFGVTRLACGDTLTLTNGGALHVYANATNGAGTDYGALVAITNDLNIAASSWIYVWSHETDGGSALFRMDNFLVADTGGIDANAAGFKTTAGPGKGDDGERRRGGGYGGRGGAGQFGGTLGLECGLTNAPVLPGSGGCLTDTGGYGGGSIRVEARGNIVLDGTLKAEGGSFNNGYGSGGSGGGILLTCDQFLGGASGTVQADGGTSASLSGGGGGGRISIAIGLSDADRAKLLNGQSISNLTSYSTHSDFLGSLTVIGGTGFASGSPGSQVFLSTFLSLTVVGDPGNYGSPGPDTYGTSADKADGEWITNSVASPADTTNGMRHACLGWDLTNAVGSVVSNGVSTTAVFQVSENVVLTWNWTNEYLLAVATTPNGITTTSSNGWHTNATQIGGLTATPSNGYAFLQWTGDVPPGSETNNPLTVTMDQARSLAANYVSTTGVTKIWNGIETWLSSSNWTPGGIPGTLDDVVIQSGTVTLSQPFTMVSLIVSNGATMVVSNWSTTLTITKDVTIRNTGEITLPGSFAEGGVSSRVHIVCSNFMMDAGSLIDVDGSGYEAANGLGKGSTSPARAPHIRRSAFIAIPP